jgi:CheY-like chemotaxis protein
LTRRLLSFSRKQTLRAEPIEVAALLQEVKALLERTLGERVQVRVISSQKVWSVLADRAQLENAILNLAINARDAMPDGGELEIEASNITLDDAYVAGHPDARTGTYVSISVRDTGVGMTADRLPRAFEPFFTTKEVGSGTGLGLSMVYGFVRQSGGHVTIESRVGIGTQVNLFLPSTDAQVQTPNAESQGDTPQGRGESILVVEDEPAVRKLVSSTLRELGYQVTEAQDGNEALMLLEGIESLDLLLSDVVLPGKLSGRDLVIHVERERPGTQTLLMSGYASKVLMEGGDLRPVPELLNKPFRKDELARKVRSALDS